MDETPLIITTSDSSVVPVLKVHRLYDDVILPKYSTENSACFDIHAYITQDSRPLVYPRHNRPYEEMVIFGNERQILHGGDRVLIPTGLIFDIPPGYSLRLHPRSGLALKHGITLVNAEGIVDEDYIQEVKIILLNTSQFFATIKNGDRICQAELVEDKRAQLIEIDAPPNIKTNRSGGFGSTGI